MRRLHVLDVSRALLTTIEEATTEIEGTSARSRPVATTTATTEIAHKEATRISVTKRTGALEGQAVVTGATTGETTTEEAAKVVSSCEIVKFLSFNRKMCHRLG